MTPKNHFGDGLRLARKAKGKSQEDFADSSSRTYISTLERGKKSPTLDKIEAVAATVGCHPATLVVLGYLGAPQDEREVTKLLDLVRSEIGEMSIYAAAE